MGKPFGAMSSPYGGNIFNDVTVRNTDYVKQSEPFTESEFEDVKKRLEDMGAILKAKNSRMIVFEMDGKGYQICKN